VISFIFFFGYSSMRRGPGFEGEAVATVDGRPIPAGEYRMLLDQNYERLRETFEGQEVPEFVQKMAARSALAQLVSRELAVAQADELGIVVPDTELARAVRATAAANRDGEFDAVFYKTQFLPYFKNRFGIDYETYLRNGIAVQTLAETFVGVDQKPAFPEEASGGRMKWTFETVTIDPAALEGPLSKIEEARKLAEVLIDNKPSTWRGMLKAVGVEPERVGPVEIKNRKALLGGQATFEDHEAIFALTEDEPVLDRPIERGGKVYVVRLVERIVDETSKPYAWPAGEYFQSWMSALRAKAEVISFLNEE
jgi:hypothetical protein